MCVCVCLRACVYVCVCVRVCECVFACVRPHEHVRQSLLWKLIIKSCFFYPLFYYFAFLSLALLPPCQYITVLVVVVVVVVVVKATQGSLITEFCLGFTIDLSKFVALYFILHFTGSLLTNCHGLA